MQNRFPRSAVRRPLQSRRVALISGAFLALVVAAVMIEQTFDGPLRRLVSVPPVERDVSHVGAIRLGPGHDGRCPQYVFDNDSGWIVPSGRVTCDPFDQPTARFGGNGTDRMDTIRDGFRRR